MKKVCLSLFFLLACHLIFAQEPTVKPIYFGGGSAYIDEEQVEKIRVLIDSIPNLDRVQIAISSHTDNIGGVEYNQWLSEQRSQAVLRELSKNNILPETVQIKDNGQLNPSYSNDSHLGRMANRRVDIIVTPLNF